jgi:hypothetical protein
MMMMKTNPVRPAPNPTYSSYFHPIWMIWKIRSITIFPNWMEEMKKIQGDRGSGPLGVGRGRGGNKICQEAAAAPPIHFLRFKV